MVFSMERCYERKASIGRNCVTASLRQCIVVSEVPALTHLIKVSINISIAQTYRRVGFTHSQIFFDSINGLVDPFS